MARFRRKRKWGCATTPTDLRPGAVVRPYYSDLFEILIGIEVEVYIEISLKGGEQFEGLEVEGFHVSCVECPLIIGTEGAACGGTLCHFAKWLGDPGE